MSSAALNPNLIGPTFPPIPSFTLPTGPTGNTRTTGPVPQSAFRAENFISQPITEVFTKVLFPTLIFDLNRLYKQ
ncbi:exosporium leader peptide-containing protein [Bacillus fungorum]|uniref:exosporium leader peptide-containing protein n=1 Tax=Bacillus fungorum TaxID=2039284 RepID=UPI0033990E9A